MSDDRARLGAALAGRYAVQRELGRGGMATVYLATDLANKRPVAIKVLDPLVARVVGPQRFLQEIRLAARLVHPHIMPLYDAGDEGGFLYHVMPHAEGGNLRAHLRHEQRLALEEAIRIVREVASGVDHAHGAHVIHRDIKPENVLFVGGTALLADFGIARVIDAVGVDRLTETGLVVGTPAYMSPEQAAASGTLDVRADVYSLGCVAWEMLAGEPPFTASAPLAVLARHAADPVPSLRVIRPDVPLDVERAIERALAKRPRARFASAGSFAETLVAANRRTT